MQKKRLKTENSCHRTPNDLHNPEHRTSNVKPGTRNLPPVLNGTGGRVNPKQRQQQPARMTRSDGRQSTSKLDFT
jgi:hypothetical protein